MKEIISREQRAKRALSICRRGELGSGNVLAPAISRAFLKDLRNFDSFLELYWHPYKKLFYLYRMKARRGCASDDMMVKEAEVCGPKGEYRHPGPWLLGRLRQWELTLGGQHDLDKARRSWLNEHLRSKEEWDADQEKYYDAADKETIEDLRRAFVGRDSAMVDVNFEKGKVMA